MSDTETQTHILALKLRERDLELEACSVRARIEEIRSMLDMLENPRRPRGRPPRNASAANQNPMQGLQAHLNPHPSQILEMPARMDGGMGEATPEPDSAA